LAMQDRGEETKAAVAQLLTRIPRYSIAREIRLHKPGSARDALVSALRMAGFPQ